MSTHLTFGPSGSARRVANGKEKSIVNPYGQCLVLRGMLIDMHSWDVEGDRV